MDTSERVLVIILAAALAVFLILAIVAVVKVIQILNKLKSITEKAEHLADKAEAVGEFLEQSAVPVAAGRLLSKVARAFMKHKHQGKGRDE